jgi:hypothetical protein
MPQREPFVVKDCALVAMATGRKAQTLKELRDLLREVEDVSIYHHFWGRLLQPQFDEPEYNNDFAAWAFHRLHHQELAERLSVVNPTEFPSMDAVREELIEIAETVLDESEWVAYARADRAFHFVKSQIVVFDTGVSLKTPEALGDVVPRMSSGNIFYHFIDARRRTPMGKDDFSAWLEGYGDRYLPLLDALGSIDPYFSSLEEIRSILGEIFSQQMMREI